MNACNDDVGTVAGMLKPAVAGMQWSRLEWWLMRGKTCSTLKENATGWSCNVQKDKETCEVVGC